MARRPRRGRRRRALPGAAPPPAARGTPRAPSQRRRAAGPLNAPPASAAVRLHRWTDGALVRVASATKGAHDGLWLGLAGAGLLDAIDADFYDRTAQFHDPAYNRSGLLPWEAAAVERFFAPSGRRVAVTAAGGGREVLALQAAGYDAAGFECHPPLVAAARGLGADVQPSARHEWPEAATGPYDGVIVGWGSYMHIPGRSLRVDFLRRAREAMVPGPCAPILLSFYTRPRDTAYLRAVAAVARPMRRLRGRPPVEVGDSLLPNFAHQFTEAEIGAELADAGFEPAWFADEPYGHAVGLARPWP